MNAEQKQRAAELLAAWRATVYALHADRMADLLQELVDASEAEPFAVIHLDGSFVHVEFKQTIAGTGKFEVYAAPPVPSLLDDVARDAGRYRWLLKQAWFQQAVDRFDLPDGGLQKRFEKCMDEFIDATMGEKGQS